MENIEVLLEHLDGMWGAAQMYCGDDAYGDGYRAIRAALVEGQKPSTNRQRVPFVKSAVSLCVLHGMVYQLVSIAIYHKWHSFARRCVKCKDLFEL